jgi:hypothetical protein
MRKGLRFWIEAVYEPLGSYPKVVQMIFEQGVHVHTTKAVGIAGLVFEYLVLVPVVPVEPIPGTEPHESLGVLNNRINSNLR